jgi:hypothetical protein
MCVYINYYLIIYIRMRVCVYLQSRLVQAVRDNRTGLQARVEI